MQETVTTTTILMPANDAPPGCTKTKKANLNANHARTKRRRMLPASPKRIATSDATWCSTSSSTKPLTQKHALIANPATPATANPVLNATPARIAQMAANYFARLANTVKQEQQQTKARRARIARRVVTNFPVAKPCVPSATLAGTQTKRAK
jgi:hypothetical protein